MQLWKKTDNTDQYRDYSLVFVILFLSLFGLVMIYSASYYSAQLRFSDGSFHFVKRQAAWLVVGLTVMWIVSRMPYRFFAALWPLAWAAAVLLMILVNYSPLGIERNNSRRWLGFNNRPLFQPTEFVKIALILAMAVAIGKYTRQLGRARVILHVLVLTMIPGYLVLDNNLSSGLIILGISAAMYLVAVRERWPVAAVGGLLLAAIVCARPLVSRAAALGLLRGYRGRRLLVWLDPTAYPQDGGYQVLQGLYAIGSGGLFGKGLGNSMQKLGFIPEAENDMIFSVICEELGLFGAACVMLLFLFLLYRMLIIANNAPDLLGSMIVTGVMAHIALQVILNIAVVINLIPNTGVSLPFISYGGSSLLFFMAEMGLVLSVANRISFVSKQEQ